MKILKILSLCLVLVMLLGAAVAFTHVDEKKSGSGGYDISNDSSLDSEKNDPDSESEPEEPESEAYQLSGSWLFSEKLRDNGYMGLENVEFVSDGVLCTVMYVDPDGMSGDRALLYFQSDGDVDFTVVYDWFKGVWVAEDYRTITFDGVQTVSKEFYDWFTATADPVYTLSGSYILNSTLTFGDLDEEDIIEDVEFELSAYGTYCNFFVDNFARKVTFTEKSNSFMYTVYKDGKWNEEYYRYVSFNADTPVSKEFYEWFTANAAPMVELSSGTYTFYETLSWPPETGTWPYLVEAEFEFVSNGTTYDHMLADADGGEWLMYSGDFVYCFVGDTWVSEDYRTINVGVGQMVNKEFYAWLIANTTHNHTGGSP